MNGIPGDSLYPGYCGFVQSFDAEDGDFIEGGATMLESMIRGIGIPAEGPSATDASISPSTSPIGFIESVTNDCSGIGSLGHRALTVGAAETLHCSWTAFGVWI